MKWKEWLTLPTDGRKDLAGGYICNVSWRMRKCVPDVHQTGVEAKEVPSHLPTEVTEFRCPKKNTGHEVRRETKIKSPLSTDYVPSTLNTLLIPAFVTTIWIMYH